MFANWHSHQSDNSSKKQQLRQALTALTCRIVVCERAIVHYGPAVWHYANFVYVRFEALVCMFVCAYVCVYACSQLWSVFALHKDAYV